MKQLIIGSKWKVNYTTTEAKLPYQVIDKSLKILPEWAKIFPREDNWSQKNLNIPSLLVRVEGVIDKRDEFRVFEIEERPAGVGIGFYVDTKFAQNVERMNWPDFKVLSSFRRQGAGDDYLWRDIIESDPDDSELLLIRAEPDESEYWELSGRSVSSLKEKGNKSYGVHFGWWREVSSSEDLPWDRNFIIKPIQGSKARGIEIWDHEKRPGSSTKTKIERTLREHKSVYVQDLVVPPEVEGGFMLYRVFFGYNMNTNSWECLGGMYNVRPNLRIHGASNSFFGPLSF